jgi:L-lactate dehydrogenase complex protein LldG
MADTAADARTHILGQIRKRLEDDPDRASTVEARLRRPRPNLIPAQAKADNRERPRLFLAKAQAAGATIEGVAAADAIPAAVVEYLKRNNLPLAVRLAPAPMWRALPWSEHMLLDVSQGTARPEDTVSLTPAFAGIAETGTLMLISAEETPTTLNFLPDVHIVVLSVADLLGSLEDAFAKLRRHIRGVTRWPRSVNLITGPSRTADIEQTLVMGAHGPRRLHILLLAAGAAK